MLYLASGPVCIMSSRSSGTSTTVLDETVCPAVAGVREDSRTSDDTVMPINNEVYKVTALDPKDDPRNFNIMKKWLITLLICNGSLCATFASSVVCAYWSTYVLAW